MFVCFILQIAYFIRIELILMKFIPIDWAFNHSEDLSVLASSFNLTMYFYLLILY